MLEVNLYKFLRGANPSSTQCRSLITLILQWRLEKVDNFLLLHLPCLYLQSFARGRYYLFFTILSGHCRIRLEDA